MPSIRQSTRCALAAAASVILLAGCNGLEQVEKAPVRPDPVKLDRGNAPAIDVPQIMRGTVASESVVLGYGDVVVRGFGLVVGLRGTGSRVLPADIRAYMIREMGVRGVGLAPLDEFTPDELLDSLDTAVVVVEGVVPAGAPKGTKFDVRVYAAPGTSTTSLEGGRLFSCDLRPGQATTGNRQASVLGIAAGPVFVNPFVAPGRGTEGGAVATRFAGRILDGGKTTRDMPLKLRLFTPSHNRAATLQSAINANFPREPGQREVTGRGESGTAIEITIPPSFRKEPRDFIELLRHTTLSYDAPEAVAMQVRRALLSSPGEGEHATWRFRSLGVRCLPIVQELYTHPETGPRMAALRAGAELNDQLVVPPLVDLAREGSTEQRILAIELLGDMGINPVIDSALREFLQSDDVDVRAQAFISLAKRRDPSVECRPQGNKFELWSGKSKVPTVFLSQGGTPRLAVASNEPVRLELPITLRTWANRLMIKGDAGDDHVEVYYRPDPEASDRTIADAPLDLIEFIQFLAHRPTAERPKPGLDLSYAEVIGVLHELVAAKALKVDFKSEQDRLLARIQKLDAESDESMRPEFGDPEFEFLEPGDEPAVAAGATPDGAPGSASAAGRSGDQLAPLGTAAAPKSGPGTGSGGSTRGGIVPR